jgi:hypothetical protein
MSEISVNIPDSAQSRECPMMQLPAPRSCSNDQPFK